jgi:shikimate kinase
MPISSKIFLIGLAGSGKSTLGKALAKTLGVSFLDLDEEIVAIEGQTIPEIFSEQGEEYFRAIEGQVLKTFADQEMNFIMATGGGTPCFMDNMRLMNETGLTIYLDVDSSHLASRVIDAGVENRPIFKGADRSSLIDEIDQLRIKRSPFYDQAKIKMSNNHITEEMIITHLKDLNLL